MTVLAGKLQAMHLYTGAKRSLTLASVPFVPEGLKAAAVTRADHRLSVAADVVRNLDTKRSFSGLLDVTRGATELLGKGPVSSGDIRSARHAASLGRETLRAEPDVARYIAQSRANMWAGFKAAAF